MDIKNIFSLLFSKLKTINKFKISLKSGAAFTLVELLTVIGIIAILIVLAVPLFRVFQKESDLIDSSEKIINILRLAQNKTLALKENDQWGVFFATSTDPNQYILFKGSDYESRDPSSDVIYEFLKTIEIYEINLPQGSEVIFNPVIGTTDQFGNISVRLKNDHQKTSVIYIEPFGQVGLIEPLSVSDSERIKDSRRLHFNYNRSIDVFSEKLILTFEEEVIQEIIIQDALKDNQIYWQGEINVQGEIQKIIIHTLELNNPDSLFCIHRDQRYNKKTLKIKISGDQSGSLIEYSADGLTTIKTSIYATDPQWQ